MSEELCRATYVAHQIAGTVLIIAFGKHETSGFEVRFQDTPIAVFPPEFRFVHTEPSGPVAQVETEFLAFKTFPSDNPVDIVRVHDADGDHEVRVLQISDAEVVCEAPFTGNPTTPPPYK